jgi:hypothetical protein
LRQPLTERYRERLAGVLSCYDRMIVTGTLPLDVLLDLGLDENRDTGLIPLLQRRRRRDRAVDQAQGGSDRVI